MAHPGLDTSPSASPLLVVGPAWVGDMVMAHTLVQLLARRYPDQSIHMLAPQSAAPIARRMAEVSQVHLMPVGHARFSYGRGHWDEFWCLDGSTEGLWLSADEGDYALERNLRQSAWPVGFRATISTVTEILGDTFTVTEAETAECLAVRGEFPEELEVGEAHLYFDLTGPDGRMATYERWDGGEAWSIGEWVDPWEVTPL